MATLGQQILDRRMELKWPRNELSRRTGIPGSTLKGYEESTSTPPPERLKKLNETLGLHLVVEQYAADSVRCQSCKHYWQAEQACLYILDTNEQRGEPAGDTCSKYERGHR